MKKILMVEDTPHLSEEIADILRLEGYRVTIAHNGQRALELLPGSNPDLIITDLLMPGMDGFELIQQVRSMASFKSVPILIFSAKSSDVDKLRGKEAGADAFIGKPCKAFELVASINSLLKIKDVSKIA
jgi:DNA-binding response OmpR family regulator